MEYRPIRRAGTEVSTIGIGTRGLASRTGASDGARALAAALDAGCTLLDVAPSWGDAQTLVGQVVREQRARDRVTVASLLDPIATPSSGAPGGVNPRTARAAAPPLASALPIAYVQRAVEDSLRALRLDAIPLVLLNRWRDAWLDDSGWRSLRDTLERLVREGKVLAWGVAARDGAPDDAIRACAEPWVVAVQVRRSVFDRGADDALLPAAHAAQVAVLVREPLAGGALTGELLPAAQLPTRDERSAWLPTRVAAIVPDLARLATWVTHPPPAATASPDARSISAQPKPADLSLRTLTELALRDAIAPPAVTAAVVGARTVAHALDALAVADGRGMPPAVRAALDARRWGEAWYA